MLQGGYSKGGMEMTMLVTHTVKIITFALELVLNMSSSWQVCLEGTNL